MNGGGLDNESSHGCPVSEEADLSCFARLQQSHGAMNGNNFQRRVTITNPQGFHMRPQAAFVQAAKSFESTVTVTRDQQRVNGKSQWELMLLAAENGVELTLEVSGPDAVLAMETLAKILASPTSEEPPEESLPKKG